jgi:hypothetical protein
VTLYVPGSVELYKQERVAVPPEARLVLDGQDTVTAEGAETARPIDPARPERLVRVTVPLPEDGDVKETDDAEILKSRMVT